MLLVALVAGCDAEQPSTVPDQPGRPSQSGQSSEGVGGQRPVGAEELAACPPAGSLPPAANGLPDLSLPCLGNGPDTRLADLRGPLLINVWAQWCPPCRHEAPYLAELQRKAGQKVRLLGIDYADPRPEKAVEFAVEHQLSYPHLADPDKQLASPLRIVGPPVTVFVTEKGQVAYVHRGPFISQRQLDQLVEEKLGIAL
jgi:cytochrome c biogenesis protein CcmG, thiol:disulfide interchange protein DsbE